MNLKKAFTLLSILIFVIPMVGLVVLYSGDLTGVVLPPAVKDELTGGGLQERILPKLIDEKIYPSLNSVTFFFSFKNPLSSEITVSTISSDIVAADDGTTIAHISIDNAYKIKPQQTVTMQVSGQLAPGALNYFRHYLNANSNNDDLHVVFRNLDVVAGGISAHSDESDAGWIMIKGYI